MPENQWESGYREDGRSANVFCPGTSLSLNWNWKRLAVRMGSAGLREREDALLGRKVWSTRVLRLVHRL